MYSLPRKGAVEQLALPIRYVPFARSPKIEHDTVGLATMPHVKDCINRLALVVRPDESNVGRGITPKRNHAYEAIVISVSPLKNDLWLGTVFKKGSSGNRMGEFRV